ncbi:OsmC family protein [Ramlibacter sp. PS3R-8]|uniref:OsmC family protein n=1 Tax=Ramlibacter sp. PS3R-8 TaxID=3133437 RepID=UPI0030B2DF30
MASHECTVEWSRAGARFVDQQYSRAHAWRFDGGAVVAASSSPHSVRVPLSDPAAVDPEEALVAAVSSCHMLWFLSLAAQRGVVVDSYRDAAQGRMGAFADGKRGIVEVLLRPEVRVAGDAPADGEIEALHHAAHERCDIAHSIRGDVRVQGSWRAVDAN